MDVRELIDALERMTAGNGPVSPDTEVCTYSQGMDTPVGMWLAGGKLVISGTPPPEGHRVFPTLWDALGRDGG